MEGSAGMLCDSRTEIPVLPRCEGCRGAGRAEPCAARSCASSAVLSCQAQTFSLPLKQVSNTENSRGKVALWGHFWYFQLLVTCAYCIFIHVFVPPYTFIKSGFNVTFERTTYNGK